MVAHAHDVDADPVGLAGHRARRTRPRRRGDRGTVKPSHEQRLARGWIRQPEGVVDQRFGLPEREAATHHHRARCMLVATWQPAHRDRRPRRDQPEPHVGLHERIKRLDQHQPAPDPARVSLHPPRDLGLRQLILAVERAHQPPRSLG
ncbi:MAG: hypothetical protein ABIY55_28305 [Kofleriaceae bacterium]